MIEEEEEGGKGERESGDAHIVPVRFRPSTITFMGRVRTDGSVSTRRGFDVAMIALTELDMAAESIGALLGRLIDGSAG